MIEDDVAHALYEKTAALARATSSRRLPKLRTLPSSPTTWALAAQQSIPLHKLTSHVSLAAGAAKSGNHSSLQAVQPTESCPHLSCANVIQPSMQPAKFSLGTESKARGHAPLGREAQLLNAPYRQTSNNNMVQLSQPGQTVDPAKKSNAELGEAVAFEERYHRAGREVLGQRVDVNAVKAAAKEHKRRQAKARTKRLGFKHIEHSHDIRHATSLSAVHVQQRYQHASAI